MKSCFSLFLLLAVSLYVSCEGRVHIRPLELTRSPNSHVQEHEIRGNYNLKAIGPEVPIEVSSSITNKSTIQVQTLKSNTKSSKLEGECAIPIRGGLVNPTPVFLQTNSNQFYPYNDTGVMIIDAGKSFQLWCPSQFTKFNSTLLTATCIGGKTFRTDGNTYNIKEFVCKSWPNYNAQKTDVRCNGGIMVRVGFNISATRFAKQMDVCFNEKEEVTRYVHYTLSPASNDFEKDVGRLTFQTDGFFDGKNVDKLYTQSQQQATISNELGIKAVKYFNTKSVFLARGHMAAKADFVYGTKQRATFLFINVAPQWQSFNAGNWQRVETSLRKWVSQKRKSVECYTGVWGITTLPDYRGIETPLYLTYDINHNGLIPVPKLYFRIVIEPDTKKGIVFIGVNNPHLSLEQIKKDYIICNDVSNKVTYINWKKTDITEGYSYACEVDEFVKKVTHLPKLSATGGLLI